MKTDLQQGVVVLLLASLFWPGPVGEWYDNWELVDVGIKITRRCQWGYNYVCNDKASRHPSPWGLWFMVFFIVYQLLYKGTPVEYSRCRYWSQNSVSHYGTFVSKRRLFLPPGSLISGHTVWQTREAEFQLPFAPVPLARCPWSRHKVPKNVWLS